MRRESIRSASGSIKAEVRYDLGMKQLIKHPKSADAFDMLIDNLKTACIGCQNNPLAQHAVIGTESMEDAGLLRDDSLQSLRAITEKGRKYLADHHVSCG